MKILFLVFGILSIFYLLIVFLSAPSSKKHADLEKIKGKYIAHRGLHNETIPENSIAAFQAAVENDYPIEIDLHLTKDGKVVVFHDGTLKRMCGVDGKIVDMTLDELKKFHLLDSEESIPTLEECLACVQGKTPLLIEFKMENGNTNALCTKADKILASYNGTYLVQSFYPQVVQWYKHHRKSVCRGQLACQFKKPNFFKWLSGNLLLNFMGRPHFVSYRHSDKNAIMLKFVVWLGAFPFGWTYQTSKDLKVNGASFKAWIFEHVTPNK